MAVDKMISKRTQTLIYKDHFELIELERELENSLKRIQWLRTRIEHLKKKNERTI